MPAIIWRLCCSSVVLLHQKHEGKCFMFWDIRGGYKKVSEDGKPPGMVLKDCKRQRAEATAVPPTVLLGAAAGLNCPQNWAQVLFWRKIVGSICKTVQEHTFSHVVHVHQEKCNKNWGTELFTRLEICSGATQGHFIIFLLSWSAGAWSGWWEAEPGLPLLPHQSSAQERGCAPSWVKMGSFTWRAIGGIPWEELRNKLRLYPRGTCTKQFWAPADTRYSETAQTYFFFSRYVFQPSFPRSPEMCSYFSSFFFFFFPSTFCLH